MQNGMSASIQMPLSRGSFTTDTGQATMEGIVLFFSTKDERENDVREDGQRSAQRTKRPMHKGFFFLSFRSEVLCYH